MSGDTAAKGLVLILLILVVVLFGTPYFIARRRNCVRLRLIKYLTIFLPISAYIISLIVDINFIRIPPTLMVSLWILPTITLTIVVFFLSINSKK